MRNMAMDALIEFIGEIKAARLARASEEQLAGPCDLQRKAQFLLDFVESENSMGFHAPEESERLLFLSLDYTRQGQKATRALGIALPATASGATSATLTSSGNR
jgi:nitrite reductase (cytochrome c-552)